MCFFLLNRTHFRYEQTGIKVIKRVLRQSNKIKTNFYFLFLYNDLKVTREKIVNLNDYAETLTEKLVCIFNNDTRTLLLL